jgi:hypothetical protein
VVKPSVLFKKRAFRNFKIFFAEVECEERKGIKIVDEEELKTYVALKGDNSRCMIQDLSEVRE